MSNFHKIFCTALLMSLVLTQYNDTLFGKIDLQIEVVNLKSLKFTAVVPKNSYLGIGFGDSMVNVDMVAFKVGASSGTVEDMWSTGFYRPSTDTKNDYTTTSTYSSTTSKATFQSTRLLNTGDSYDYIVSLGSTVTLSAVYASTQDVTNHGSSVVYIQLVLSEDGTVSGTTIEADTMKIVKVHGWIMWAAWGILGFVQIVSNRYMKGFWKIHMWIHRLAGTLILLSTIALGIVGIKASDWELSGDEPHTVIGLIVFFAVLFVALGGIFARSRTVRLKWRTKQILRYQFVHKMAGRLIIALSQVSILTGVISYNEAFALGEDDESPLGIIHIIIFFAVCLIVEILFQVYKRLQTPFREPPINMTIDEFSERVQKGDQLVILDDMVLNVSSYMQNHPGGKFLINHNVGKDISKFFYGGYALENFSGKPNNHTHSNIARFQVNSLIIARLAYNAPKFQAKIINKNEVNPHTKTVTFQANQAVVGLKTFYSDINMIGKHFLVRDVSRPRVKRHYTVSNCMERSAYVEYLKLISNGKSVEYNGKLFEEQNSHQISLTIKNYKEPHGLSMGIIENENQTFEIQGPMGKGLGIQRSGTQIAFTAGTGCLVFVDLVAHLIRKNLGLTTPQENKQLEPNFKFIFYMSFRSKHDAIALGLCQGLVDICKVKGIDNFQMVVRFSNDTKEQWNKQFLEESLKLHSKTLSRVWVCGPPKLNELFDKYLEEFMPKFNLGPHDYEIL